MSLGFCQQVRRLLFFACIGFMFFSHGKIQAQTTLAPGDLAFVSLKVSNDGFAFVTFKNLCPRTVIYFTDNPYRNSGGFCTSQEEFCISLTVTTTIPAGTQVSYTDGAPGTFTIPAGAGTIAWAFTSAAGQNNGFSSGGDNCFAFQGTYAIPSFICAIKTSSYTASGSVNCTDRGHTELPSSLTLGVSALFVNVGSTDGIYYNCGTTSGTTAALRAAMANSSNWTNGTSTIIRPCSFTVTDAPADPCSVTCSCNIWSEDFNTTRYPTRAVTGANSNTANPAADWTTSATDCDDGAPFATTNQSYWGTLNGIFECNDIEGGPCGCTTGGTTLNEWLSEVIDISGYTNVAICAAFAHSGTMEANISANACNNADDIIQGEYRLNGGPWTSWFFDDDEVNLSPATTSGLNGTTLQLRIFVGNKANDEHYTFDNVCVTGTPIGLPVELLQFDASWFGQTQTLLTWTTSSETDNDYFAIEKTTNGVNWQQIGTVAGYGTSSASHAYSFVDEEMIRTETYYRLRQVDFNGHVSYSPIRSLVPQELHAVTIFPNPASDYFTVNGLTAGQENSIQLYDHTGKLVQSVTTYDPSVVVSTEALAAGIYFVRVFCTDAEWNFKLIRTEH